MTARQLLLKSVSRGDRSPSARALVTGLPRWHVHLPRRDLRPTSGAAEAATARGGVLAGRRGLSGLLGIRGVGLNLVGTHDLVGVRPTVLGVLTAVKHRPDDTVHRFDGVDVGKGLVAQRLPEESTGLQPRAAVPGEGVTHLADELGDAAVGGLVREGNLNVGHEDLRIECTA
jgi:hypothetical protein